MEQLFVLRTLGLLVYQQGSRLYPTSHQPRLSLEKVSPTPWSNYLCFRLNVGEVTGLNQRPTFFGCNASQAELDDGMPLIIYLPNSPLNGSYLTNASTYKLDYSRADTQSFLNSMWTTQTRGYPQSGQAQDSDWGTCLACSIVERRRQSQNMTRSSTCETCFTMYCYDYEDSSADGGYSMGAEISASEVACE